MYGEMVEKYYARLAKEGWINALLSALAIGFSVLLATSTVFWLTDFKHPWIAFIITAVAVAGATLLMYYKKFRPSKKKIAKRVDALGLEERLLTMVELEGDDSYIAQRQREDAKAAIASVSSKFVKIVVSIPMVVLASILVLTGGAMATVSILSSSGIISSGKEIITEAVAPDPVFYEVEFVEEGGGVIDGEIFQMVEEGQGIAEVTAIPDDEWYLHQWVWEIDGVEYTLEETDVFYVEELTVNQNIVVTAVFAEITMGEQQQGGGEGEQGEEGEEGDQQEPSEQQGEESEESESETEESDDSSDKPGGNEAGGKNDPQHSVIDGETDYGGEVYNNAVEDAMEDVSGNDDIPDDWKDIIDDYFGNIQKD